MTVADLLAIPPAEPASPSTAWREIIEPDEQALFEGFAREIMAWQKSDAPARGPLRGFHAKLHVGLMAEFKVLADLPAPARVGVFSTPRVFPALVRFSNGESVAWPDKRPEPRGIAIKLIGVPGRKVLPGQETAITQDFLATSHSVTSAVRNVKQFMAFVRAKRSGWKLPFKLIGALGLREALRILNALVWTVVLSDVRSMATEQFGSTAPIKYGPYAVKFTVQPAPGTADPRHRPLTVDFLREELADRLSRGDVVLDFLVQFYVDETRTPIEDTSVAWEAPFLKVAQLRIPRCDLDSPLTSAQSEMVDQLSFSPWHAMEDHRPLGNVMRARRVVYQASSALRGHRPEPTQVPLTAI